MASSGTALTVYTRVLGVTVLSYYLDGADIVRFEFRTMSKKLSDYRPGQGVGVLRG